MSSTEKHPVTPNIPKSFGNNIINLVGLFAFFSAVFYCRTQGYDGVFGTIFCTAVYGACVITLEVLLLKTPARPGTGLSFARYNWSADRVFYKLVGLYACYGFVAFLYWQLDRYRDDFFQPYWEALDMMMPYVALVAVPYIALVDGFMKNPEDNYFCLGKLLLTWKLETTWKALGQLLMGWIVKGYFLPLMFIYFVGDINYIVSLDLSDTNITFLNVFHPFVSLVFVLDLLAAVAGYALTFRLFDTHIRSVEPTVLGWLVCLACYDPFNGIFLSLYADYRGHDERWIEWLEPMNTYLLMLWGGMTFLAILVYSVAGMNFGVRFSNLTHRGVMTNGMYRYTKHPEYISKNWFWWTTFIPFTAAGDGGDGIDALHYILLMLMVNLTYFMRARTEERHMSRDPVYVQYALWMNEHGIFAWLGRLIPFFRYKPPANWENLPYPYTGIK
ncbi:MAG: DUF1295 domain-containing protein [Proteobacteria bacterium]|nr:DUF1295 domain-containing protein [Pseudomonadota bacterium]